MWIALKLALSWLIGNPLVQAVALNVVKDLITHGKDLIPIALTKIKEVAPDTEMSGRQKFAVVTSAVSAEFPSIGNSVVDTIVQTAYNAYVNPNIKEVV
jgi:hypothetical protein